jgi:hypothetical protein
MFFAFCVTSEKWKSIKYYFYKVVTMTEEVTVMKAPSRFGALRNRLMITGAATLPLVGFASAAIDLSNITELIDAVTGLVPSLIDLVIAIAPLLIILAIVSFIIKFFDRILEMINLR